MYSGDRIADLDKDTSMVHLLHISRLLTLLTHSLTVVDFGAVLRAVPKQPSGCWV